MKKGIYPGTFDPITLGHLDIIKRSLSVVDNLVIGVAEAYHKTPLFSQEERVAMVQADVELAGIADRVEVIGFSGLLVAAAKENDAGVIIRGLRAVSDFEYEFQLASMNTKLDGGVQTMFLPASESHQFVASNLVKEAARLGADVGSFVSPHVMAALHNKF